jgi:hypothetical protein
MEEPRIYIETAEKIIADAEGRVVLSSEQQRILEEISNIINKYYSNFEGGVITEEVVVENMDKVKAFYLKLLADGVKPDSYILWHRLVGSGIGGSMHNIAKGEKSFAGMEYYFDMSDSRIEKYIRELYKDVI